MRCCDTSDLVPGYRDADPLKVADAAATYELGTVTPHQSIHAVVVESEGRYVAECLENAIVTQGATLDETLAHPRAVAASGRLADPAAVAAFIAALSRARPSLDRLRCRGQRSGTVRVAMRTPVAENLSVLFAAHGRP